MPARSTWRISREGKKQYRNYTPGINVLQVVNILVLNTSGFPVSSYTRVVVK